MKYVVSAYFWLLFGLSLPGVFLGGLVVWAVTTPFDRNRRWVHLYLCRCAWLYVHLVPTWDVRVLHRERLPEGPAVLVANHQSMADIVAALVLGAPFKFVSKASVFRLPWVGALMRLARYVPLVRGAPRSTRRMMEACAAWLRRGESVLLFPEGTYAGGGRRLPFRRGAFELAVQGGVPVVPVALHGTRGLVVGDGPWLSPRCRIRIEVLPWQPVAERPADVDALCGAVQAQLHAALERAP